MLLREPPVSSAQRTCSEMLLNVCAGLDAAGIDWCVSHGYAMYPEDVDPNDGGAILRATWYRQWPRYSFVTSAALLSLPISFERPAS